MKKVLALVLSLTMLLALVPAALADGLTVGTYDPASAGTTEVGFAWWGNQVRDEVTKAATDYFTENYPNITFNLNTNVWNNYWSLMTTYAANNDLPDLMQQDYAYLELWATNGNLLDLTPYIESGALDLSKVPQNIIDTGKVGDGIYAVCAGVNAPSLLYNKTLTDSLGIEVPQNLTWDQFVDISRQIYEATGVGVVYGEGNSENNLLFYVRSLGYTALCDANGMTATAEELSGYYQRLLDGVSEGWMFDTDKIAGVNVVDLAQHPLVYGTTNDVRAWCAFAYSNQLASFKVAADADGIELGVTNWPSIDPVKSNYVKPSQFFAVTSDTKNPDLAVAILNYLINDVEANKILQAERGVPANSDVASAITESVSATSDVYGTCVSYLEYVNANCSAIFPAQPGYLGTVQTEVLQTLSEDCLTKGTSMTAEEAGQYLYEMTAEIAADY
jgi:multiple sugar transport system substrate-binding protein